MGLDWIDLEIRKEQTNVYFQHSTLGRMKIVFHYPHKHSRKRSTVYANIYRPGAEGKFDSLHSVGGATCNLKAGDKFSKPEGRLLALMRAVSQMGRVDRSAAWRAYWERGVNG